MHPSHFINGEWRKGQGSEFFSYNPATNHIIWRGQEALKQDIDAAVLAAQSASKIWAKQPLAKRIDYLETFHHELETNKEALAQVISDEVGKPVWEALTEVTAVLNKVGISIQAYEERSGTKQQLSGTTYHCLEHRPLGVLAVLGPFNFPAHLPHGHIIPALLAGNTVVFKASELTPKVAEFMINLWHKIGLPAGVINLIQGGRTTGQALIDHHDINGLLFTGSYQTGRAIHERFAGKPEKLLALEMGGNNPLIVADIDKLDAACYHTILSAFITSGQRCTCARRLIVLKGRTGDQFLERLVELTSTISVGINTAQPEPFMGPLISKQAAIRCLEHQEKLLSKRGKVLLKMEHLDVKTGLVSPGIIDATFVKPLVDEEIFGPILNVFRAKDFQEALDLANQTKYGLSAGLLSENKGHFEQFYHQIHAGIINWNKPTIGASSNSPFGGIGHSGNYRPGAYYAADYCAYPVASMQEEALSMPESLLPGIRL